LDKLAGETWLNCVLTVLARVSFWAAVLELVGTALIVWGLKLTPNTGAWYRPPGENAREIPHAGIVREHPWAVTVGTWLLLLGLALQVIASVFQ
jgi:hypothetical protein